MASPKVSVVIPTYKRLGYLKHAVAGVRAQSFTDFEVIVSDNANEPEVKRFIESLGDARFSYHGQRINLGLFQNLNSAILKARGEIIAFLEDDCRWPDKRFLEKMAEAYDRYPDCPLAICRNCEIIGSDGRGGYRRMAGFLPPFRNPFEDDAFFEDGPEGVKFVPKERMLSALARRNVIWSPMATYSRKTLERHGLFDPSAMMTGDWLHYLKLSLFCDFPVFDSTVEYMIHDASATTGLLGPENLNVNAAEFVSTHYKFSGFCKKSGRRDAAGRLAPAVSERGVLLFVLNLRRGFSPKAALFTAFMFLAFDPLRAAYRLVHDRYGRAF
ncbi:MAG: glycosyltransferase family A protein [Candidatus ainarchaeum sp.]|nr:glycosyltransferase family A protein [Candidatus ainarchaeum sp.]